MPKTLRRTVSVLIAVTVTTLGVYGAARVGAVIFPGSSAIASAGNQVQVCPATGCKATSCHGATGAPPPTRQSATSAKQSTPPTKQSANTVRPSAAPDVGGGSGPAVTYVCPVSGCKATSCHGATGAPPPGR